MKRNPHFAKLETRYLFQEIGDRIKDYKKKYPDKSLINLSIGDTSQPLPDVVSEAMEKKAHALSQEKTYSGYSDEQGSLLLREKISEVFYHGQIHPDEIFISDGAKCDLGRLQFLFGTNRTVALQDPAYPVYHDTSLAMGCAELLRLPITPENGFFPDLERAKEADILFFCSPNNPTGMAFSRKNLERLVSFAKKNQIVIVCDAAYNLYAEENPKSIYEISGAKDVAIEIGSFSKLVGFSGVRLGWSVVPKSLHYQDGIPMHPDWKRVGTTFFNGASNISQEGGIAALSKEGLKGIQERVSYYKENGNLLRESLQGEVFGGYEAPFLWVRFGKNEKSWVLFDYFLENYGLITTPGVGFGPTGEGFLRISTLGKRSDVIEAAKRLQSYATR